MRLPPDVLDLRGMARELGVSYATLQANWRKTPGFPPPFWGAGPGQSPRWARAAVEAFKQGRRWNATDPVPVPDSARHAVANDTTPQPVSDVTAALLAAAGA